MIGDWGLMIGEGWIPAYAGMTWVGAGYDVGGGGELMIVDWGLSIGEGWIPAFAGMTCGGAGYDVGGGGIDDCRLGIVDWGGLDSRLRGNDVGGGELMIGDCRLSIGERWIPAYAGMTWEGENC